MDKKTNVMRLLDQKKIPYQSHTYSGALSGMEAAQALGQDPGRVFKTLVTTGSSGEHFVFVIPANRELDLKKAAKAAGQKSIEMLKQKDLLPLTGYVHGGCSPIGMKKRFLTFFDCAAEEFETICFSAGKVGQQVEVALTDLAELLPVQTADLTV